MNRPVRLRRSSRPGAVEPLETRALMTIAATAPLPDLGTSPGATVAAVNLDSHFTDAQAAPNFAIFDTTLGTIPVLLTPKTTPLSVANFQGYEAKGAYTNTVVHRSVPGFIWQSGGFQLTPTSTLSTIPAAAPVANEFGASNVRGTIAMAKLGNDPNSATSQFFFNESDGNAANLDNQNGGFTVFGHVVGAAGLAVLDAVAAVPVPSPGPLSSPLDQIPLRNYTPGSTVQPSQMILIKSVTPASELFLAASDAPGVATATIQGSALTVTPQAAGTAHITVMGYGSDGTPATETFAVHVSGAPQAPTAPPATPAPPAAPTAPTSRAPAPTAPPATTPPTPTIVPPRPIAPPAASPPSALTPAARGAVPGSVVAGRKARIQQTISLTAATGPVAQRERVTLSLSATTTGSPGDVAIAGASTNVRLKAGRQAKLTLATKQIPAGVPAGVYHLLLTVTDPDGAATTVDTGRSLTVRAARP